MWFQIITALAILVFGLFVFVICFGAPYLPTLKNRTEDVIELLDLKPGQVLLELGCGDGRVLRAAARAGIKGVGYELNPILVIIAKWNTRKYRHLVQIKMADYWNAQWPEADGVYVFLLQKYMTKLDKRITHFQKVWGKDHIRLVSFAFQIDTRISAQEKNGMYVYDYSLLKNRQDKAKNTS